MKKSVPLMILGMVLALLAAGTLTRHIPLFVGTFFSGFCLLLIAACLLHRWRWPLYYSAYVVLALGLFEAYYNIRDLGAPQDINLSPLDQGYWAPDEIRGWAPRPHHYRHQRGINDGRKLWDVHYTIGADGLRLTPPADGEPVWFFGDSFTYGEGLEDAETFPWIFSELTKHQSRNFAFNGYGAHQMLRLLETGLPRTIDSRPPRWIVYTGILDHVHRAAGYLYFHRAGPHYKVVGDMAVHDGRIWDQFLLSERAYRYLIQSRLYTDVYLPLWKIRQEATDLQRYIAIVRRAKYLSEQEYRAGFVFVFWDADHGNPRLNAAADHVEQELRVSGVRVLRLSRYIPEIFGPDYTYPVDGHPNAKAQQPLAELLSRQLGKSQQ